MIRLTLVASAALLCACSNPDAAAPTEATESSDPGPSATPKGLEAHLRSEIGETADLRYAFASVDLNSDPAAEVLAYVSGRDVCGSGGCSLYVLTPTGGGWRTVTRTTVTQTPIGVLESTTEGWRDLAVSVGGGGMDAGWVRLSWNGASYPSNPTVLDGGSIDERTITTVIASDPEFSPLP